MSQTRSRLHAFQCIARHVLPSRLPVEPKTCVPAPLFITFAVRRSGQHLVIDWMGRGLRDALHINNCYFRRMRGRYVLIPGGGQTVHYLGDEVHDSGRLGTESFLASLLAASSTLVYSLEDVPLKEPRVRSLLSYYPVAAVVTIVRDPYNTIASSLRHSTVSKVVQRNVETLRKYLRHGFEKSNGVVSYNRFVIDPEYRRSIAERWKLESCEAAEKALEQVPSFGGGSSFTGTANAAELRANVFTRWREFTGHPIMQAALADEELLALTHDVVGEFPSLDEIAKLSKSARGGRERVKEGSAE